MFIFEFLFSNSPTCEKMCHSCFCHPISIAMATKILVFFLLSFTRNSSGLTSMQCTFPKIEFVSILETLYTIIRYIKGVKALIYLLCICHTHIHTQFFETVHVRYTLWRAQFQNQVKKKIIFLHLIIIQDMRT
jgi:hypothetical protein